MFGIDIFDAGLIPAMSVALIAGIVSFLSPCVLPIVPPYLAYMSGVSINEMNDEATGRRKAITAALFFVMGLSTVFILLGFAASAFGAFFLQNSTDAKLAISAPPFLSKNNPKCSLPGSTKSTKIN